MSVQGYYYTKAAHLLRVHTQRCADLEAEQITSAMWLCVTELN